MVRMGKNPRDFTGKTTSNDTLLHVGHVTSNLIDSIYAPLLQAEAKRQAEAYADSIVQAQADGNDNDDNNENVEAYPTIYKNRRVLNELDEMLNDLSKDVSSGIEWKAKARAVRFERRLNERYGILRPILFNPTLQPYIRNIQRKYALGHFSLVRQGDGPLSLSSSMILLFMLQRNKVSTPNIILTGLFLVVGLKPWVLV